MILACYFWLLLVGREIIPQMTTTHVKGIVRDVFLAHSITFRLPYSSLAHHCMQLTPPRVEGVL